jgi:hypothetical protein
MKIKAKDLSGAALDWAVATCEGFEHSSDGINPLVRLGGIGANFMILGHCATGQNKLCGYNPSARWDQAGPIIEREGISIIRCDDEWGVDAGGFCNNVRIPVWCATIGQHEWGESTEYQRHDPMYQIYTSGVVYGPTPLVAAMRCYVANKLRAEVDVPDGLRQS